MSAIGAGVTQLLPPLSRFALRAGMRRKQRVLELLGSFFERVFVLGDERESSAQRTKRTPSRAHRQIRTFSSGVDRYSLASYLEA